MSQVEKEVEQLLLSLEQDNDEILKRFNFVFAQKPLSHEEGARFLDFLRKELKERG